YFWPIAPFGENCESTFVTLVSLILLLLCKGSRGAKANGLVDTIQVLEMPSTLGEQSLYQNPSPLIWTFGSYHTRTKCCARRFAGVLPWRTPGLVYCMRNPLCIYCARY